MTVHAENKRLLWELWHQLEGAPPSAVGKVVEQACHRDSVWRLAEPLNELRGPSVVAESFFAPLAGAMPDWEPRLDLLFAGSFADQDWVTTTGHLTGTLTGPLFGVPSTGGIVSFRFGSFHAIADGRIGDSYLLFDLLDLMRQAGVWFLPPSPGVEGCFPGPATHDGLLLGPRDAIEGDKTIALADAMVVGLLDYDGQTLESMAQERFWHPAMMWYGPCGIGSARGLKGFQDYHQIPFLKAFPDRKGGYHLASFGDGNYAGWVGWPSLEATHSGGDWLGLAPTGRSITMRVMDFYRREDELLRENWVFIDILDILIQLGLDPFARLASEARHRR